jgi:hypothetical protein
MLTGKQFKLENPTLALEVIDGKRVAVSILAGALIMVVSGPKNEGAALTLKALWDGRTVTMFAVDVSVRGTEIKEGKRQGLGVSDKRARRESRN